MEAGHRDQLVQDAPLLGPPAVAVSLDDRRHEFIPRRHAHPPHRYLPDPIRVGSISDEATDQHSGTFLARQCAPSSRSSRYSLGRWSSRAVAHRLLLLLVAALVPQGPVVIGLDDTIERRWGAKIKARGIYRDPVRSSQGHFVKASGLRWLCVMLLASA